MSFTWWPSILNFHVFSYIFSVVETSSLLCVSSVLMKNFTEKVQYGKYVDVLIQIQSKLYLCAINT